MATQPTPITDKNGKATTVHKNVDAGVTNNVDRVAGVASPKKKKNLDPNKPLDVWLKFDSDEDDEPTYEANTYPTESGFRIDWYHEGVAQVMSVDFDTIEDVHAWYEAQGYSDFSS